MNDFDEIEFPPDYAPRRERMWSRNREAFLAEQRLKRLAREALEEQRALARGDDCLCVAELGCAEDECPHCAVLDGEDFCPKDPAVGAGCCTACGGTGKDVTAPETGGQCWDCRGTGHPHEGDCT